MEDPHDGDKSADRDKLAVGSGLVGDLVGLTVEVHDKHDGADTILLEK